MAEPSAAHDDDEPVILTGVTDRVGTFTMNRPARRNALNGELIGALDGAVRQMADDPDAKVIVLTGAAPEGGHGGFCSGGDVKGGGRGSPGSEKGVPRDALSGDLARHDLHAAMLLQSSGRANAMRALLKSEIERGPDFLRLANALSALYPKESDEKRLLDAMLLAVPR